ncbi:zf-RanBP domain-containing protein [Cephalotus follicularis]|uniref:Zf-RanBP domain-containing protein n=1 Tax=Cephalotus follicularis TaxID=3775 RepID=A0A1Q3C259_CEPFO|nr:zf-RanBP domain-containing protein [Cephalotus follicularis]
MGEGREGDWECSGCKNMNYAFRLFRNRCKQPRLLVDTKTPSNSKWLPRIGDWICTGCTTNNYASREKCKKCGQPKDVAAMPAIAMTGASLPSYSQYFASAQGRSERLVGNSALQQSLPLISNWSVGGAGVQPSSNWPLGGNLGAGLPYANPTNHTVSVPKEWRNGDWVSNCGFHNYLSRLECKNCNSSMPPALGTKRLASEEFAHLWDNKRLNSGHTNAPHQSYPGFEQNAGTIDAKPGLSSGVALHWQASVLQAPVQQAPVLFPYQATTPTLLGKGYILFSGSFNICIHFSVTD